MMNIIGLVLFAVIAVTQDVRAQIDTRAQQDNTPVGMLTFAYPKATAGNYSETDLYAAGVDLTHLNNVIFKTRGRGAAHVLLQKDRGVFDTNVVEIVIGAEGNKKSYIRDDSGTNRATNKGKGLPYARFGTFWARWNDTCIWVGRGDKVRKNPMMSWCGLSYNLDYISASYYGAESRGVFKFFKTATELTYYCEYSDNVNYDQFDLFADGVDIRTTTSIVFSTTGSNGAHILLMQDEGVYDDNAVEVILGGSCNKNSMIRNVGDTSPVDTRNERDMISSTNARYFWISWANDCVLVGKGYIVGKTAFMGGCSLSLTINYISASYGYRSDGYFTFIRTVSMPLDMSVPTTVPPTTPSTVPPIAPSTVPPTAPSTMSPTTTSTVTPTVPSTVPSTVSPTVQPTNTSTGTFIYHVIIKFSSLNFNQTFMTDMTSKDTNDFIKLNISPDLKAVFNNASYSIVSLRPGSIMVDCHVEGGLELRQNVTKTIEGKPHLALEAFDLITESDLPSCLDTTYVEPFLEKCYDNLAMLQSYTCGQWLDFGKCVLGQMNMERPVGFACSLDHLANATMKLMAMNNISSDYEDLFSCRAFNLTMTISTGGMICDSRDRVKAVLDEIMDDVFTAPSNVQYLGDHCTGGYHTFVILVQAAEYEKDIRTSLQKHSYNYDNITIYFNLEQIDYVLDRCRDERTILWVLRNGVCLDQSRSYSLDNTCSLVEELRSCVEGELTEALRYIVYCYGRIVAFEDPDSLDNIMAVIEEKGRIDLAAILEMYDPMSCVPDAYECSDYNLYTDLLDTQCDEELLSFRSIEFHEQCRMGIEGLVGCVKKGLMSLSGKQCSDDIVKDTLKSYWYSLQMKFEEKWPQRFDPYECDRTSIYHVIIKFSSLTFNQTFMTDMTSKDTNDFIKLNISPDLKAVFNNASYSIVSLRPGSIMVDCHVEGGLEIRQNVTKTIEGKPHLSLEAFDPIMVSVLVCFRPNFNRSLQDYCVESWEKFNMTGDCWHLEMLLSCMKYNAVIRGQTCPLVDLYPELKKLLQQIYNATTTTNNHNRTTSPDSHNGTTVGPINKCFTTEGSLKALDDDFQAAQTNFCHYWRLNRYFVEYKCYHDLETLTDNEACLMVKATKGCVQYEISQTGVNCTRASIDEIFTNPNVTKPIFDMVGPSNCDTTLSECEEEVLYKSPAMAQCYSSVTALSTLGAFMPVMDIGNADNSTSLACSVFRDNLQCVSSHISPEACEPNPVTGFVEPETISDIVSSVSSIMQKYYNREIMKYFSSQPSMPHLEPQILNLGRDCIDIEYEVQLECPTSRAVADTLISQCTIQIRLMANIYPWIDLCWAGPEIIKGCAQRVLSQLGVERCDLSIEQLTENAVEDYTEFFNDTLGYDPLRCGTLSKCYAEFQLRQECFSPLYWLMTAFFYNMNEYEVCGSESYARGVFKMCFMKQDIQEECKRDEMLDSMYDMTRNSLKGNSTQVGFWDNCDTDWSDPCESYGAVTLLKCYTENNYEACGTLACITQHPAPGDCMFEDDSQVVKNKAELLLHYPLYCYEPQQMVASVRLLNETFLPVFYNREAPETMALIAFYYDQIQSLFQIPIYVAGVFPGSAVFEVVGNGTFDEMNEIKARVLKQDAFALDGLYVENNRDPQEVSPCDERYFEKSKDDCDKEWTQFSMSQTCENYEGYLGCIILQARSMKQRCEVRVVHNYLLEKMPEGYYVELCECEDPNCADRLVELQTDVLPRNREGICDNERVFEHMTRRCYPDGYDGTADAFKCRTLNRLTDQCVHPILSDLADCTEDQSWDLLNRTYQCVRDTSDRCEWRLSDRIAESDCLDVLRVMQGLSPTVNMSMFLSYNGEETLQCRLLTEQINCLKVTTNMMSLPQMCSTEIVVRVVRQVLGQDPRTAVAYDQCQVDPMRLTGEISRCPTDDLIIDGITAYCGPKVINSNDACISYYQCAMEAVTAMAYYYKKVCPNLRTHAYEVVLRDQAFVQYFAMATEFDLQECDGPCVQSLIPYVQGGCVDNLSSLEMLAMTPRDLDLETFMTSDGSDTLRCLMLQRQTKCLVHTTNVSTIFTNVCNITNLVDVVEKVVKNSEHYYGDGGTFCPAGVDFNYMSSPYEVCVGESYIVDVLASSCGYSVYSADMISQCSAAETCFSWVKIGLSMMTFDQCPNTWQKLEDVMAGNLFKDYFRNVSGLYVEDCAEEKCMNQMIEKSHCLKEFYNLIEFLDIMDGNEICGSAHLVQRGIKECLGNEGASQECLDDDMITAALNSMARYVGKEEIFTTCDYDLCSAYGAALVVHCYSMFEVHDGCGLAFCLMEKWSEIDPSINACPYDFRIALEASDRLMWQRPDCFNYHTFAVSGRLLNETFSEALYDMDGQEARTLRQEYITRMQEVFSYNFQFTRFEHGSVRFEGKFNANINYLRNITNRVDKEASWLEVDSIRTQADTAAKDPSPCSPSYFDHATNAVCGDEWADKLSSEDCSFYEAFLGCVLINARARRPQGHLCPARVIHDYISRKVAEYGINETLTLCECEGTENECDRLSEIDQMMPASRSDICVNGAWFHHLLYRHCLGDSYIATAPRTCRSKGLAALQCVHPILQGLADCDVQHSLDMLRTNHYCTDADLPKECDNKLLGLIKQDGCFDVLFRLDKMAFSREIDLSTFESSSPGQNLRCSWFQEQIKCTIQTGDLQEIIDQGCDYESLVLAARQVLNTYEYTRGNYDLCEVDPAYFDATYYGCPSKYYLIDAVTAYCGPQLMETPECWVLDQCLSQVEGGVSSLYDTSCPGLGYNLREMANDTMFTNYFEMATGVDLQKKDCADSDTKALR